MALRDGLKVIEEPSGTTGEKVEAVATLVFNPEQDKALDCEVFRIRERQRQVVVSCVAIGGSGITVNLVDNYCADRAPLDNHRPIVAYRGTG
jgi:hypothetical protein